MIKTTKVYEIHSEIFPYTLYVVYGKNMSINNIILNEINKGNIGLINMEGIDDAANSDACVYNDNMSTDIYLFISNNLTLDILVHECIHITSRIFEIMGSEINSHTEELFAYINQNIFKQCYNLITNEIKVKLKVEV